MADTAILHHIPGGAITHGTQTSGQIMWETTKPDSETMSLGSSLPTTLAQPPFWLSLPSFLLLKPSTFLRVS